MAWLVLLLALSAPAGAGEAATRAGALSALADQVAAQAGAPEAGRRGLSLSLTAPAGLGPPLRAALTGALGRAGWVVGVEGGDWRLELTAGAEGEALVAVGQQVALWPSFFLQARPGVPAAPPRLVSARVPADAAARLLLAPAPRAALSGAVLRRLATLPYPALALAAGDAGEGGPSILVVSPGVVHLLDASGAELASRHLDPSGRRPVRLAAATAVIGPLGGGRLGVAVAGAAGGEVLVRHGGRLDLAATLPLAPLAAGGGGLLFGAFAPGKGALQDLLVTSADPAAAPRSGRDLAAAAAAPGGGAVAFAVLSPGGGLSLLDGALTARGQVAGVGAGFALGDLDGDGQAELVASRATPAPPDALRLLVLDGVGAGPPAWQAGPPAWESGPLPVAFTAGAAADLTGDGLDDALLAAEMPGPDGLPVTELWLVTLDARGSR